MPSGNYARKDIQMFCGECGASYNVLRKVKCSDGRYLCLKCRKRINDSKYFNSNKDKLLERQRKRSIEYRKKKREIIGYKLIRNNHNHHKPFDFYEDDNGCFVCTSHTKTKDGYPKFKCNRKHYNAHNYIYQECFGEVPDGLVVRHTCDNPACINPEHLILGTKNDNVQDMVTRERQARGIKHWSCKLSEEEVLTIRDSLISNSKLAEEYGVSKTTIARIKNKVIWKHL